jgi:mannan endo-1,4-beta-mannosidase
VPRDGLVRADNDVFYTNSGDHKADGTAFRIPYKDGKLDKSSPAWALLQEDMDLAAAELAKLKALDIPVLWRPLHEAVGNWGKFSGGDAWFWWGASGPEPYKALYEYMFNYFTNEKQLNNLIWVWNGQDAKWFPDERTVDLVGNDLYPPAHDYGSQIAKFRETEAMVPNKNRGSKQPGSKQPLVALTENGVIPDPDNLIKDGAKWSFFMTWNDSAPAGTNGGNFWSGDHHNEAAHKQKVYNHPYVITLDKLPDLTKD